MKVIGLDGKERTLELAGKKPFSNDTRPRSSGHKICRELLKELYPVALILEEVTLAGTDSLKADFLIPFHRIIIEVCGRQHYEYIDWFHKDRRGWVRAQTNDRNKKTWAEINNFRLIELPDTQSIEKWKEIIQL